MRYYFQTEQGNFLCKRNCTFFLGANFGEALFFKKPNTALNTFWGREIPFSLIDGINFSLFKTPNNTMQSATKLCDGIRYDLTFEEAEAITIPINIDFSKNVFIQKEIKRGKTSSVEGNAVTFTPKIGYLDEDENDIITNSYVATSRNISRELKLIEDFKTPFDNFVSSLNRLKKLPNSEALAASEKDISKELIDILHYIEFEKFDVYKGYKALVLLQNKLIERRVVKDKIAIRAQFDKLSLNSDKDIITSLCHALDISRRNYVPRANSDLFENGV